MVDDKILIEWSADFVLTPVYMSENFIDYYEHEDHEGVHFVLGKSIEWEHRPAKLGKTVEWNPLVDRNQTQMVIEKLYDEIEDAVAFTDHYAKAIRDNLTPDDKYLVEAAFDLAFQLTPREIVETAYEVVNKC